MGSEESWQPKDWWSSLGMNGWPLLMGSFYREELLCAVSAQTRRALVTGLLSYLLWINKYPFLILSLNKSKCCCNVSQIPTPLVVNIRSVPSPRWTIHVLQLIRRLCFAKNKLHCAKHMSKVTWKGHRAAEFHKQHLDVFCHCFWSSGHCSFILFPFTHQPFPTPFTKVSSSLEQQACISLKRTLMNINWCSQITKLLKICGLWLITKYMLCYIQEY